MSHESWLNSIQYRREKMYKRANELEIQIPKLRYDDFKRLLWEVRRLK